MSLARVLLCGCLLLACTAPAPAPEQPPPPAAPPQPTPTPVEVVVKAETPPDPTPPPVVEPAPVLALDTAIGVEACDAYVGRYRACIDERVPAGEKEQHTRALQAQLNSWLAAKADPKLAPALDGECAAASAAARASTRVLGCVWREGDAAAPEIPKGGTLKPETRTMPRGVRGFDDPFGELE